MEFEWDEAKRRLNLTKHGLDFLEAAELFSGPMVVMGDARQDYGEERFIGFGLVKGRLLAVVFAKRGRTIRIISMRKGNSREKARFNQEIVDQLAQN